MRKPRRSYNDHHQEGTSCRTREATRLPSVAPTRGPAAPRVVLLNDLQQCTKTCRKMIIRRNSGPKPRSWSRAPRVMFSKTTVLRRPPTRTMTVEVVRRRRRRGRRSPGATPMSSLKARWVTRIPAKLRVNTTGQKRAARTEKTVTAAICAPGKTSTENLKASTGLGPGSGSRTPMPVVPVPPPPNKLRPLLPGPRVVPAQRISKGKIPYQNQNEISDAGFGYTRRTKSQKSSK
ncbi:unnamed protein product [Amoebophrya sp. A120]|nr:unnamed protein product [Amoebophrya sp. A120]|eukprot:GSA120T00023624001.1